MWHLSQLSELWRFADVRICVLCNPSSFAAGPAFIPIWYNADGNAVKSLRPVRQHRKVLVKPTGQLLLGPWEWWAPIRPSWPLLGCWPSLWASPKVSPRSTRSTEKCELNSFFLLLLLFLDVVCRTVTDSIFFKNIFLQGQTRADKDTQGQTW